MSTLVLEMRGVSGGYGGTQVVRDVSLEIPTGSVTALLGPNGAGKTTLLRLMAGTLRVKSGSVHLQGTDVTKDRPNKRARTGLCLVPEGRGVFPNLTVAENMRLAVPPWAKETSYTVALEAFPTLGDRLRQRAGSMSGGQQQMLALSRCFLSQPSVVLLDEVSMGLAPKVIDEIFGAIRTLADQGVALLVVEQYVQRALEMADALYLMNRGSIRFAGAPGDIDADALQHHYLGDSSPGSPAEAPSAVAANRK